MINLVTSITYFFLCISTFVTFTTPCLLLGKIWLVKLYNWKLPTDIQGCRIIPLFLGGKYNIWNWYGTKTQTFVSSPFTKTWCLGMNLWALLPINPPSLFVSPAFYTHFLIERTYKRKHIHLESEMKSLEKIYYW